MVTVVASGLGSYDHGHPRRRMRDAPPVFVPQIPGWTCCGRLHPVDFFRCPWCGQERPVAASLHVSRERVQAAQRRRERNAA